jgi:DNA-binding NtrC family response regulator
MPPVRLDEDARILLMNFQWPGNVRQLKNITEQISIIEQQRDITANILKVYLPASGTSNLPAVFRGVNEKTFNNEREILYQVLFDMKRDMNDLKKLVLDLMGDRDEVHVNDDHAQIFRKLYPTEKVEVVAEKKTSSPIQIDSFSKENIMDTEEFIEESLSLEDKEIELIRKALEKHSGKRKLAAQELGISERTLYRKIKEYDIDG